MRLSEIKEAFSSALFNLQISHKYAKFLAIYHRLLKSSIFDSRFFLINIF
jgi:hypothetical protein